MVMIAETTTKFTNLFFIYEYEICRYQKCMSRSSGLKYEKLIEI